MLPCMELAYHISPTYIAFSFHFCFFSEFLPHYFTHDRPSRLFLYERKMKIKVQAKKMKIVFELFADIKGKNCKDFVNLCMLH